MVFLTRIRPGLSLTHPRSFVSLFQYCIDGESTAPFGVDPVFVPTSSLFNPDEVANIGEYYTPREITSLGVPVGFYSEDTGNGDPGFPLVFDINLDQAGAQARLQALVDGLFLDNATDSLSLHLVTYNGEHDARRACSTCRNSGFARTQTLLQRIGDAFNHKVQNQMALLFTN